LEDFTVSKLGRVNLIVGKNNSGKSTVLEALRIYAGNAHPKLLEDIAAGHDEKYQLNGREGLESQATMPFEDLFTGRQFSYVKDNTIIIGESNSEQALKIEHDLVTDLRKNVNDETIRFHQHVTQPSQSSPSFVIAAERTSIDTLCIKKGQQSFEIDFYSTQSNFRNALAGITPCSYIPTQLISVDELAKEWDNIVGTEYEEVVRQAMRIILPEFENIYFVLNDNPSPSTNGSQRTAKVKLPKLPRPVPLKSLGDGMLRVLQIAIKLVSAQGGFLLIDEFENGLHYSVQEKIWELLFEMAEKLDIQIFATTHSWDCIESFSKVAFENETTEGVLFRMGRSAKTSNKGQVIATVYDKERLYNITQADIEVR
jgi:AAA15 family ATPase/GTPase